MPLIDLSHTSHTAARTGIQRVARTLRQSWGDAAEPICRDPYLGGWRRLERWELARLEPKESGADRKARWPFRIRWRGRIRRALGRGLPPSLALPDRAQGLIVPEFFGPKTAAAFPDLFARVRGPKVAIFYDAIPLRLPELTPSKTVARFPAYLRELLAFDAVAAISEDSRESLLSYWRWLGAAQPPPVVAIPLGVDLPRLNGTPPARSDSTPTVLFVSTLEGRKNHLALLEACDRLWAEGRSFGLRLIGLAHPESGRPALERIGALRRAGRPVRHDGPAGEAELAAAYRECAFTVYPSLLEGFGLPVLESLAHGKPCVCSGRGALGESARGGGCLTLDGPGADELAGALRLLLGDPGRLAALEAEARARTFRSWGDYAAEVLAWMGSVPPRR